MRFIAINVAWYAWIVYWLGGAAWLLTTSDRLEAVGPLLLLAAVIAVVGGRMALEPSKPPLEISTSGTFYELPPKDCS
jgi:hypothetical protein